MVLIIGRTSVGSLNYEIMTLGSNLLQSKEVNTVKLIKSTNVTQIWLFTTDLPVRASLLLLGFNTLCVEYYCGC